MNLEDIAKKMQDAFVKSLAKNLNEAFTRAAKKDNVAETDIQLAIRHHYTGDVHEVMAKAFSNYAQKLGTSQDNIQLAVRFRDLPSGDADFFYEVLKDWKPATETKFLGSKTDILNEWVIRELPGLNKDVGAKKWSEVALIFYLGEGQSETIPGQEVPKPVITMGFFHKGEDGQMKLKKDMDFTVVPLRDESYIYYEILNNWKFTRRASFPKDFLGQSTIMPDPMQKEKTIKMYLVGGFDMKGNKLTGQFEKIAIQYSTSWENTAVVFFKDASAGEPKGAVCIVNDEQEYMRKESVDLFATAEETKAT